VKSDQDRETADDDDRERQGEPPRHRPPPEVERLRVLRPEQQETEDEAEVRRVEDVRAAELDHVLGKERDGGGAREDRPAVQAPPVAVLGPGDPQDEGDSVPGQHRARRPHQHVLAEEGDAHFEDRAGTDRDQDLGDRQPEVERDLAEDLERDDHRGEVEPSVAQPREEDRVRPAADHQSPPGGSS
jgi:hypothetical protein